VGRVSEGGSDRSVNDQARGDPHSAISRSRTRRSTFERPLLPPRAPRTGTGGPGDLLDSVGTRGQSIKASLHGF